MREVAHAQKQNPLSDFMVKFYMTRDVPCVITGAKFGDDRLRGLGVTGGQILPFPIDYDRRLYNTLVLPCECVIPLAPELIRQTRPKPYHFSGLVIIISLSI